MGLNDEKWECDNTKDRSGIWHGGGPEEPRALGKKVEQKGGKGRHLSNGGGGLLMII